MSDDELEAAVDRGDVQAVKKALERGVSPNFKFAVKGVRESKSLLYLAAQVRELEGNFLLFVANSLLIGNSAVKKTWLLCCLITVLTLAEKIWLTRRRFISQQRYGGFEREDFMLYPVWLLT